MAEVKIVAWQDSYKDNFRALSVEWLEKYVSVEPSDIEMMEDPHGTILDGGGMIFFAQAGDDLVGTVAMIKLDDQCYELAKLAVTEQYKGMKIGHLLMEAGLGYARDRGAKKVILYTAKKLRPAISLYRKLGFVEVPLGNNKYLESDMKMELAL